MRLEYQILAALALDFILGDPRCLPHPVRLIGRLAVWIEPRYRQRIRQPHCAGILAMLSVLGLAAGVSWILWQGAAFAHPLLGDAVAVWLMYTTFAARDLAQHSSAVYRALVAGDGALARTKVGMIVGRDTQALDESEITRATVETVAESTLDGCTAPIFFALLLGPVGAVAYRTINTLDSIFGHKDDRYVAFGWASARIDDVANYIPARLTGPVMALAAWCLGWNARRAWAVMWRDSRRHPSPNSGFPEAAMAGALDVQLGGRNYYDGIPEDRARIGDPVCPLAREHIPAANRMMYATVLLFSALGCAIRWWVSGGL